MSVKALGNNRTTVTLLLAAFVAIESYFISLILGSIVGRFWLSGVVLQILAVFGAYVITDAVIHRVEGSRRKKVMIAIVVLVGTVILAVALLVLTLYLQKLDVSTRLR